MTERDKSVLMWLIVAVVFFIGIWICKGQPEPTQGAAAIETLEKLSRIKQLYALPQPKRWVTNTLIWEYPSNLMSQVQGFRVYQSNNRTTNWTTNWLIVNGLAAKVARFRGSTNTFAASTIGTNGTESTLSATATIPAIVPTNLIICITGNGLASSTSGMYGTWQNVIGNAIWITNPTGPMKLWRGKGLKESHTWQ